MDTLDSACDALRLLPGLQKQLQCAEPLLCKNGKSYQWAVFSLFPQITYGFVLGWSYHWEDK